MTDIPFPDDWVECQQPVWPTGVHFVDELLGGGQRDGGIYAVLGPYGSGKTTLAIMLAAEAARTFATKEPEKAAFLIACETHYGEVLTRALSYTFAIPRDAFRNHPSISDALRGAGVRPGEALFLHDHLRIFCPGRDDGASNCLTGGIDGVAAAIEQTADNERIRPGIVVIDYVGGLARYAADDPFEVNRMIAAAPLEAHRKLATRFGCPVWLIHQLSADANRRGKRGYRLQAVNADGDNDFAGCLDSALVLGTPHPQTGLMRIDADRIVDDRPQKSVLVTHRADCWGMDAIREGVVLDDGRANKGDPDSGDVDPGLNDVVL